MEHRALIEIMLLTKKGLVYQNAGWLILVLVTTVRGQLRPAVWWCV